MREYVKSPETVAELPTDAKVTGQAVIVWVRAGEAFVRVNAHHNDSLPAIQFRGRDWLASAHYVRSDDGTWQLKDDSYASVSQRGAIGNDTAPRTYRSAILVALAQAVQAHWTPELDAAAAYAHASNRLRELDAQADELRAKLAELAELRAPHFAIVDAHNVAAAQAARDAHNGRA